MKKIIVLLACVLMLTIVSCVPVAAQAQKMKRTSKGWEQVSQPSTKDSIDTKEVYTYKGRDYKIWLSSRGSAYVWIPKTRSQGMRKQYLGKEQNIFYQQKMRFNAKKSNK